MLKLSIFLTRRANLDHEQFVDYWTEHHTPLIATLPPGEVKVHRYIQLLPTPDGIPGVETADYDGVAELWVDDIDDAAAWFTSDTYATVIVPDEEVFLDRSKTRFLYTHESHVFG